ncbi:hypothetical protein ScPMuIL_003650 [Solemya velum]
MEEERRRKFELKAGQGVAKVVTRLREAQETGHLDLSACELTQIPQAVFFMMKNTVVKTCDLSHNLLKKLPSKFFIAFPRLTELHLGSNRLNTIPEEIKQVSGLRDVDISGNSFTCVPSVLYQMENLRKLDASKNDIFDMDVSKLKNVVSLTDVNLEDNPLPEPLLTQLSEIELFRVSVSSIQPQAHTSTTPDSLDGVD